MGLEKWVQHAVANVLERVLGTFVEGIDVDSLKLDALGGDITLTALTLKLSAFEALDLPVAVANGRLGSVRVKVPWRNLGSEPMLISIETLHLLLTPLPASAASAEAVAREAASALATKREALAAWESVQDGGKEEGLSWVDAQVDKLVRSLLQRLEVTIRDVHVRVQEYLGEGALAAGIVLQSLRIVDLPAPTRGDARTIAQKVERLVRKSVTIEGLGVYLTTPQAGTTASASASSQAGGAESGAESGAEGGAEGGGGVMRAATLDLSEAMATLAATLDEPITPRAHKSKAIIAPGDAPGGPPSSTVPRARHGIVDGILLAPDASADASEYVLAPLSLHLALELDPGREGASKDEHPPWPKLKMEAAVDAELALGLRHAQMGALLAMVETISRKERRHRFRSCGRPLMPPTTSRTAGAGVSSAVLWWQYATRAVSFLASEDTSAVTWLQLTKLKRQLTCKQQFTQAQYMHHHQIPYSHGTPQPSRGGWSDFKDKTQAVQPGECSPPPPV